MPMDLQVLLSALDRELADAWEELCGDLPQVEVHRASDLFFETRQRDLPCGELLQSGTAAITAVDCAVVVHEEDCPRECTIEREPVQVHAMHLHESNADKLVQQAQQLIICGDGHLVVQCLAGHSRHTAKGNQQGLAGLGGFRVARFDVVVNPEVCHLVL